MFETTLHQTLQDKDNPDYVEREGPFRVRDFKKAYLGNGYYFWDDHWDLAHWWGEKHCSNKYFICKADFKIEKDDFCDLVGSRQDQKYIAQCFETFKAHHLNLAQLIEMLKEIENQPHMKGIFSYKAIRAVEIHENSFEEMIVNFASDRPGITSLTPRIIVCLINKDPAILTNFKILYPDKYVI